MSVDRLSGGPTRIRALAGEPRRRPLLVVPIYSCRLSGAWACRAWRQA